ncbi:hypothetical protein EVAR_59034_1 [Eumeta japonica]|uniref:Uncharacterized protein n=1 Tax=Eumeta variegata TaxID=151549 RepID=A0A4C1Z6D8_EUMVA|nr:hypothetical protein EVAR_59034_1 [Eumeta japonica]
MPPLVWPVEGEKRLRRRFPWERAPGRGGPGGGLGGESERDAARHAPSHTRSLRAPKRAHSKGNAPSDPHPTPPL